MEGFLCVVFHLVPGLDNLIWCLLVAKRMSPDVPLSNASINISHLGRRLLYQSFYCYSCLDYPCSGMLGMVSGLIADSQITASSEIDRTWIPENARLITSRLGWALPPTTHPYTKEWLQIDLGEEKIVRGIIVQGGKHRENKVFMRKFKIGYSYNGSDWRFIMDSSKKKVKVRVVKSYSTLERIESGIALDA